MAGSASPVDRAAGRAWVTPVAFLTLLLLTRVAVTADSGPWSVVAVHAAFVLPFLAVLPVGRTPWWSRHRWSLLAAQLGLTYVPFLLFGPDWIPGMSGLLGGLLLLTVTARVAWPLFAGLVAADGALRIVVIGVTEIADASTVTYLFTAPLDIGLTLYGLGRLADLVAQLHAARDELVSRSVHAEREAASRLVGRAIGDRLAEVAAQAETARCELLAGRPDQAAAQVTVAARNARGALAQIREVVAGRAQATATAGSGETVAPSLARLVLAALLGGFSTQTLMNVGSTEPGRSVLLAVIAVTAVIVAAQWYLSAVAREPDRLRVWLVLAGLVLLTMGVAPLLDWQMLGMAGFGAGSLLLVLPHRWRWVSVAALLAGVAVWVTVVSGLGVSGVFYWPAATATTALAVYGLSQLTVLAATVEQTRGELARVAVLRERQRLGRDVHDLLGVGLSAVALKADLVERLIERGDADAAPELDELHRAAERARSGIRSVIDQDGDLSLVDELDAAREVLGSAGIETCCAVSDPQGRVPRVIEVVLAAILREAVTNVLRHSRATRCAIELTVGNGMVRLEVTNDGLGDPSPAARPTGRGLLNLADRAESVGGSVRGQRSGAEFRLVTEIPLRVPA